MQAAWAQADPEGAAEHCLELVQHGYAPARELAAALAAHGSCVGDASALPLAAFALAHCADEQVAAALGMTCALWMACECVCVCVCVFVCVCVCVCVKQAAGWELLPHCLGAVFR
jgi:hypothetical protein